MQDIMDEILRGESKTLEFKEQMPANQSIVKTVIAFANTSGGKLIIGVNDDREIVGITDDIFELQDKISSIIYESCYPALLPHMYTKNIEGKILLVIDVNRGSLVPNVIKLRKNN
jgi:ATP-dependent DNA helicase RecG